MERKLCYLCGSRREKARSYRKSLARQRSCNASTTMGDGVFSGVRANELSQRRTALRVSSEFSVKDRHGKFVVQ
jgi:hypothetical protein